MYHMGGYMPAPRVACRSTTWLGYNGFLCTAHRGRYEDLGIHDYIDGWIPARPMTCSESMETMNEDRIRVVFQPNGRQGNVAKGANLLEAARELGVEIESICGGRQTCGKCKIATEEGDFAKFGIASSPAHLSPPGERERAYADRAGFAPNERLSCACSILADVVIRVPVESQVRKQIVRKGIGVERPITVDAAMRLHYVELGPAAITDGMGDWERLCKALEETHGLVNLEADLYVLRELQPALAAGNRCVTVTVWNRQSIVRVQPGFHDDIYGVALDVGTTTMAAHLCHLRTGELLATASRMNPQVPFGEDLMSRVSYAMMNEDGTERMRDCVVDGINGMLAEVAGEAGILPHDIVEMVVVGNTTMHHLILGVNPRELGGTPFSLVTHGSLNIKARDLGIHIAHAGNIYIPPCEAGHVGADNVGVLVAEAPYAQDEVVLVIDVGTNGEILLGNREAVFSASSPTGPAFEGAQILHGMRAADGAIERVRIDSMTLDVRYRLIGRDDWIHSVQDGRHMSDPQDGGDVDLAARRRAKREELLNPKLRPSGICGSGIIEAVAELVLAGVVGPNGRFVQVQHPRLRSGLGNGGGKSEFVLAWSHETSTGREIVIHSDDVRAIQLAKAALYAGAKLLMQRLELAEVPRIVLAGGFGSYIDPRHAMVLGMVPDCDLARVSAVGNAAGDGARMMLVDKNKREEAEWAARWVEYVETAGELSFQEEFISAINIPHAVDPFPVAESIIVEASKSWPAVRRAKWVKFAGGNFQEIRAMMDHGQRADAIRQNVHQQSGETQET